MNTPEQVKKLQQQSKDFFKSPVSDLQSAVTLKNILRFHEYRYYVLNDPLLSDEEYDLLFKNLEQFEILHPESITKDSPTQRVGKGLIKDFPKVQHLVPMLSLQEFLQCR